MSSDFPNCDIFKAPKYDLYWQLRERSATNKQGLKDILSSAGYEVKKSAKKNELRSLVQRVSMGRLCYDKCSHLELNEFAITRRLVDAGKSPTKRWLADRLMADDDHCSFTRMFDLPPELRKLIYEFYISDFNEESLEEPTQPPLARTCRMMRNEVLPLFYSTCTFDLKFSTMPSNGASRVRFRMDPRSFIFLTTLAPGCIGDIRLLDIQFRDAAYVLTVEDFWVDVDFNDAKLCYVDCTDGMKKNRRSIKMEVKKVLKKVARRQGRKGRKGRKGLKLQDFYNLGAAVERALE